MNGMFIAKSFNLIHMGKEKRGVGAWPRRIRKALLCPPPLRVCNTVGVSESLCLNILPMK